ncbi:unnamed protein product [Bursaphelenchus xylophilus]|uniref:Epoxide hydrolase n=1 Tax=Bursaphelenchus xylophilus TaxID=6326 RepID=A0A1I7RXV9_BURXY|nr:unnamed protein product [Bursaphelenchus xylophilus]CAG9125201.1 unnamed protein product [Bursaphelenchus xylophilus]
MGWKLLITATAFAGLALLTYNYITTEPEKVNWPTTGYFGPGKPQQDDENIHPFRIQVPDAAIQDLKNRLKQVRVTHEDLEDIHNFEYGFSKKALNIYKSYWLNEYDWRVHEKKLNEFSHFKTQIEGINLHFIHQKAVQNKYKNVIPLLMSHGWPGSVHEFSKIIPILLDPKAHGIESDFAFNVVTPSIPGFGWSSAAAKSGMNAGAVARIFHKLMLRLGYNKYAVQGGDWGSTIVSNMARLYPNNVVGCHLNTFVSSRKDVLLQSILVTVAPGFFLHEEPMKDYNFFKTLKFVIIRGGYFHLQATTPDTIGIGLNDSPIGLLAWMLEKYITGTNTKFSKSENPEEIVKKISKEDLLTAVSLYWFNGNMLQSARFYKENMNSELMQLQRQFISVPTGYASLGNDAVPAVPQRVIETAVNLTHYTFVPDLGHFAALEGPKVLAKDIFSFVEELD